MTKWLANTALILSTLLGSSLVQAEIITDESSIQVEAEHDRNKLSCELRIPSNQLEISVQIQNENPGYESGVLGAVIVADIDTRHSDDYYSFEKLRKRKFFYN